MSSTIALPVWLAILITVLAVLAVMNDLFLPGLRWFLRRRVNHVTEEVNTKLRVELPRFRLNSRELLIDRLVHDRDVMKTVEAEADKQGVTRQSLMIVVARYAHEMVPAFNAYFYFRIGHWLASGFLRALYQVRLGNAPEAALTPVPEKTAVVFFINHRSNMDYLLVTDAASQTAALSFGAGEWCRIWPFRSVLRLAGAYILRRNTDDPVYRKVLERYVQIATEARVPHAIFGQGQLSRDGMVSRPKLGLLGYMAKTFDYNGDTDILFVPVATNFDRVVEERTLLANVDTDFRGRGARFVLASTSGFALRQFWRKVTRRSSGFGIACANFGEPVSLKAWSRRHKIDFTQLDKQELFAAVERLGQDLTEQVIAIIPVLPVPAVAMALLDANDQIDEVELVRRTRGLLQAFRDLGAHVATDEDSEKAAIKTAIQLLIRRGVIVKSDEHSVAAEPKERHLLEYYANSIAQMREQISPQVRAR